MDRAPRGGGERRGRELPDLLVREAVVGGRGLLVLGQQAGRDGGTSVSASSSASGADSVHPDPHLAQVLQTEPSAEDRRDGQERFRVIRQLRRPPRDQRLHGRRHQPLGVVGERPHTVDLLDDPALAVGERHLLDDERHTLRLPVHHRGSRRLDRTAEHLGQELARLGLREPVELEVSDHTDPTHVGEQVHGLAHGRELLGPDREHQEDRARAIRADHVAEEAQAVLIRPLEVVDQDGERALGGQGPEGDGAEVEGAEQAAVGRERGQPGVILPRHRVQAARERVGHRSVVRRAEGLRRAEDRPGDQERTPELFVGGDGDRGEAVGRRPFGRRDQQPRLADPRLTLHGEPDQPAGTGRRQLLRDRLQLRRPPDDVTGRPVHVEGHRCEGQGSVLVGDRVVSQGQVRVPARAQERSVTAVNASRRVAP